MRKKRQNQPTVISASGIGTMTNKRILAMDILESNPKRHSLRLLHEPKTNLFFVFCGRHNISFYTKSYQMAERHYCHLVALS